MNKNYRLQSFKFFFTQIIILKMSIFGPKPKKQKGKEDLEVLYNNVKDLQKRLKPVSNLEKSFSDFAQNISDNRRVIFERIDEIANRHVDLRNKFDLGIEDGGKNRKINKHVNTLY